MFFKKMKKITIIIPVYNAETTLKYVFDSLESQNNKESVDNIIFINDNSSDNSLKLLNEYKARASYEILIINHNKNFGLAYNYNEGISKCNTNFFILMHQDIILEDKNSINVVISELENSDRDVVAVYPKIFHPIQIFKEYNFWQKCLFSRLINRKIEDLIGKFDGFKKDLMMRYNIFFDNDTYRTAGEDGAIRIKFLKNNLKIKNVNINVIHIHNKSKNFSLKDLIKKESQLSEYYGTLIRKTGIPNGIVNFILISFRPILVILLFVPIINLFDVILILIYSFLYTKHVYIYERKNPRILILPFVNIGLLFIASFYYFKGFVYGKQRI
jgi:glycosyltransferase involved in cell wall biosynthesis